MKVASRSSSFRGSPAFTRLGIVHLLNALGDACVTVALANSVFFNVSVSAARGRIALSLLLTMLPFAIVAPFVGPWLDRNIHKRQVVLLFTLGARAVVALGIAHYLRTWLFFPCAFLSLVCSKAYGVVKSALVPHAVADEKQLVEANSKLTTIGVVGGAVAGFVALGILHVTDSSSVVLGLACAIFLSASIAAVRLEHAELPHEEAAIVIDSRDLPKSIALAATAMSALRGMVGFVTFAMAFALRRQHRSTLEFGAVLIAGLFGSFIGAVTAPRLRKSVREERMLETALVFVFVSAVLAYYLGGIMGAIIITTALGVASNSGRMAFDSLVQRDSPAGRHGKTFARIEAGLQIMWVAGALVPVLLPLPLRIAMAFLAVTSLFVIVLYVVGGYAFVVQTYGTFRTRRAQRRAREVAKQEERNQVVEPVSEQSESGVRSLRDQLP